MDVVDGRAGQRHGGAESVRARGLVGLGEVERALLIVAPRTYAVEDVVQGVVLTDPAVALGDAARHEVHAVGGAQGQLAVVGVDEVGAVGRVGILVLHGGGAAGRGVGRGRGAGDEVVPGVVADVVGAARLVDAEQEDGAVAVAQAHAEVGAVDRHGPVGDPVRVDFAAEDADRRRVAVVGRGPHRLGGGAASREPTREKKRRAHGERMDGDQVAGEKSGSSSCCETKRVTYRRASRNPGPAGSGGAKKERRRRE